MIHIIQKSKFKHPLRVHFTGEGVVLLKDIIVKGKNEFTFTLPSTQNLITFRLLTHGDENKIERELKGLKKINKTSSNEVTVRLSHIITSINGSEDTKDIREFVNNYLLAKDARALRKYYGEVSPDVNMNCSVINAEGKEEEIKIPITLNFFWPDA